MIAGDIVEVITTDAAEPPVNTSALLAPSPVDRM
jgi:hypothetical protein